jgi:hypothetical protein
VTHTQALRQLKQELEKYIVFVSSIQEIIWGSGRILNSYKKKADKYVLDEPGEKTKVQRPKMM